MFTLFQTRMPDIVVLSGTTDRAVDWATDFFDAEAVTIFAPDTLPETVTFTGSYDGGTTYKTLQDLTGTSVKGPSAASAITYNGVFTGLTNLRIHLSAGAGADRTFGIIKSWRG